MPSASPCLRRKQASLGEAIPLNRPELRADVLPSAAAVLVRVLVCQHVGHTIFTYFFQTDPSWLSLKLRPTSVSLYSPSSRPTSTLTTPSSPRCQQRRRRNRRRTTPLRSQAQRLLRRLHPIRRRRRCIQLCRRPSSPIPRRQI